MTDQSPTPVPFVDLGLQHRRVAEEVRAGFDTVLDKTAFVLGSHVEQFEREFAEYSGVQYCIGVGNGTDALELALRGAGIGRGDEVIIPANTFVATAEAVVRAGAEIVLADCDEDYLLDPSSVADKITPRTRAVMPVHLYGQLAPMKAVRDVVGSDITIIEDAAQAQGASQDGKRAGSFGVATGTSFYPGKNLGAYGDAGAVLTDSAQITQTIQQLRSHGGIKKYEHILVGTNSRLDGLQAVVLSAKLAQLDAWNRERQEAAARYDVLLADLPQVVRPAVAPGNEHVWHLYVIRVPNRDAVLAELGANGIGAGIHYPLPVHLLPAFSFLGQGAGAHPVAERLAGEIMSLPMFPGITSDQQEVVVQCCEGLWARDEVPPLARPVRRATVTVVVPCYRYGHYLGDSVGSALAQDGVDVDVIIVDDASPDDSADVARRLADDDPRVSVIVHEVNQRHIATYNDGLTQAKGDYVLLLSADDLLVPGALARAVGVMQANPKVGMVYGFAPDLVGATPPVRRDLKHSTIWRGEQWLRAVCRSGQNPVSTPTAVMRRDVLEATGGYDPALPHTADLLMWLRAAAYADVAYVNGIDQAHYRVHGSNMHTTSFGALVTDLRERRAAFVTLAGELGDTGLGQELLASATRALVREARAARRSLDPAGVAESGRALDEFIASHALDAGSVLDRARELPGVARRTVPAIGNRVDWRYWRRFGLRL